MRRSNLIDFIKDRFESFIASIWTRDNSVERIFSIAVVHQYFSNRYRRRFMMKRAILMMVFVFMFSGNGYAHDAIRFLAPDLPPYQYQKGGQLQGIGVELIKKVMKAAKIEYSLHAASDYGAAVESVRKGVADGFFLASQNAERDEIAVFSDTLLLNNWCWFLDVNSSLRPSDASFKSKATVGTLENTNTHNWLKKNGYTVRPLEEVEALPGYLLASKKVTAVFLAELVFVKAAEKSGIAGNRYKAVVQETKPFGLYLSKQYLSENPGVMERINAAIRSVKP